MASQTSDTSHISRKNSPTRFATGVYPKKKINFSSVYSDFIRKVSPNSGAVLSFLGCARLESANGKRKVKSLRMESYAKHANNMLQRICSQVKRKYSLNEIVIIHSLGSFKPGEPVVLVVLSAPRRAAAYMALKEAVERYKKEPALFKQEVYEDGSRSWIG